MKIAIVNSTGKVGDSIRGIGVHNSELFKTLSTNSNKDVKIPEVNRNDDLSKYDVVHFTSFRPFDISLPFNKPRNTKFILTIHDLIPLVYPNIYRSGIKGKIKLLFNKFLIWKNVDRIITISETSKKDICRFLGVDPSIIDVIYLAPKEIFKERKVTSVTIDALRKKYNLPKKFVLYTGDVNYNKNIPNLIKAAEIAKIPLVIVGKQALELEHMDLNHPELIHLNQVLKTITDNKKVIRLGFVSDDDLVDIYNLAYCYVQPSLYEGFGLPVLEATMCGTPVVATKTQALVEVLGDNVHYADPKKTTDMAEGILKPNKDIKLPRSYSWKKVAEETLEVYAKA